MAGRLPAFFGPRFRPHIAGVLRSSLLNSQEG
jgi:hypothetical protein